MLNLKMYYYRNTYIDETETVSKLLSLKLKLFRNPCL